MSRGFVCMSGDCIPGDCVCMPKGCVCICLGTVCACLETVCTCLGIVCAYLRTAYVHAWECVHKSKGLRVHIWLVLCGEEESYIPR